MQAKALFDVTRLWTIIHHPAGLTPVSDENGLLDSLIDDQLSSDEVAIDLDCIINTGAISLDGSSHLEYS